VITMGATRHTAEIARGERYESTSFG
jgi:hypothetical protein